MSSFPSDFLDVLRCPHCRTGHLDVRRDGRDGTWAVCAGCGAEFGALNGIPFLAGEDFSGGVKKTIDDAEDVDLLDGERVKQANISYHDRYAGQYEQDISTYDIFVPGGPCQLRIDDVLSRASGSGGEGLLLDVCCGTGNVLLAAGKHFERVLGIDISPGMLSIARGRNLAVLGADALTMPLAGESVGCVTAFSALHHIVDYTAVVAEMARVLKPGGTFYSDWDPNGRVTHTGWAVSLGVWAVNGLRRLFTMAPIPETAEQRAAEFHHHSKRGFEAERVAETLREAGFREVEVFYHINPPRLEQSGMGNFYGLSMAILKIVSFIVPTPRNVCPWVAVRALK